MDSTDVRQQLAEAGHITLGDGSTGLAATFACDVGPHLKRTLQDHRDAHAAGANLSSSTKHGYKLPVVHNNKHNVTEKVAQVCPSYGLS